MKKFVYFLIIIILISTMKILVTASESTQSEQRSYFSLDPDSSRRRVSASGFEYYFIDAKNNLCIIDNEENIEIFLTDVVEAAASYDANFAVKTDGSLWSWGNAGRYNGSNYLGRELNDTNVFIHMSKPDKVIDNVSYIYASDRFCYAILNDNSLWGWGFDDKGYTDLYLGNGTKIGSVIPVKILDNVADVIGVRAKIHRDGSHVHAQYTGTVPVFIIIRPTSIAFPWLCSLTPQFVHVLPAICFYPAVVNPPA